MAQKRSTSALSQFVLATCLLTGLLLSVAALSSRAANPDPAVPGEIPTARPGDYPASADQHQVVRIFFEDQDQLNELAGRLDLLEYVDRQQGYALALLQADEFQALLASGIHAEVDQARTALLTTQAPPPSDGPGPLTIPGYACYRTVQESEASLHQLAAEYPDLVALWDIGDSWEKSQNTGQGHDMYVANLTNKSITGDKPKLFLMGAIHAREYATAETVLRFAEHLLAGYGSDPELTLLLDYYEVHIVPQANPDGRIHAEAGQYWRKNTNNSDGCSDPDNWGVDLNRNSSFKWGWPGSSSSPCNELFRGQSAASEPEVQALQDYIRSLFPDNRGPGDEDPAPSHTSGLLLSLHSFGEYVLYGWGWTAAPAPNDIPLRTLGRKLGYFTDYQVCQPAVPGCLYVTAGSTDDWVYGELGIPSYTLELGTWFFESCSSFESTVYPDNLQALLYAVKAARQPYRDPAGPEILAPGLDADPVVVGDIAVLRATADDTRYDSNGWGNEPVQQIAAARFTVDLPSWTGAAPLRPMNPADGTFDEPVEALWGALDTGGLLPGRHSLIVESQDADGNWGTPAAAFLCLAAAPASGDLQAPIASIADVRPASTVTYTLDVANLGLAVDTFDIFATGNQWPVSVPAQVSALPPCESQQIKVGVSVPRDAPGGSSDRATITLVSQTDPAQTTSLTLTTSVLSQNLLIEPESSIRYAQPGEIITHSLRLTNLSTVATTWDILGGGNEWESVFPASTGPLDAGQAIDLLVTVTTPAAPENLSDLLDLTFVPQGEPSPSYSAGLITRAATVYLRFPFLRR